MPRTAVPREVVIEPEPITTTPFPEATGQMREGWSQAVGIGRFYQVLSQCWTVNWFTYMVTLGGWNDPDFHASIFKRDKPSSWWKQSPKQRVWLSIWTTVSFSMRKHRVPCIQELMGGKPQSNKAQKCIGFLFRLLKRYPGLYGINVHLLAGYMSATWWNLISLFVSFRYNFPSFKLLASSLILDISQWTNTEYWGRNGSLACKAVEVPTEPANETTTTLEARGQMRQAWSKAVGLGSFI